MPRNTSAHPMAYFLPMRFRSPNRPCLAVAKDIHVAARRKAKRSFENTEVVHLHNAILVLRLEPFRQHKIAHRDAVDLVDAGLNRITDFVRNECRSMPATSVAMSGLFRSDFNSMRLFL